MTGQRSSPDALAAGWKRADLLHGRVINGDVHNNLLLVHNLLPVFVNQLLMRRRAMKTGRHQNLDVRIRLRRTNPPQEDGRDDFERHGTGVVRADDDDVFLPFASSSNLGEPMGLSSEASTSCSWDRPGLNSSTFETSVPAKFRSSISTGICFLS